MRHSTAKGRYTKLLVALCVVTWSIGDRARAQDDGVASNSEISTLTGMDLPGGDYRRLMRVTLERCRSACVDEAQCRAFTYNISARICFLKSEVQEQKVFDGATSGIKQKRAADGSSKAESLIKNWQQANAHCGSVADGKDEAAAWCEVRSALGIVLELRDWCYGKEGKPGDERRWHECGITSIHAEIPKSVSSPDKYRRSDALISVTSPEPQVTPTQQSQSPVMAEEPKHAPKAGGDVPTDAVKQADEAQQDPQGTGEQPSVIGDLPAN